VIDAEWLLAMSDFSRVVSALNYLLCFETIGSLTQRTSCSFKKKILCYLSSEVLLGTDGGGKCGGKMAVKSLMELVAI